MSWKGLRTCNAIVSKCFLLLAWHSGLWLAHPEDWPAGRIEDDRLEGPMGPEGLSLNGAENALLFFSDAGGLGLCQSDSWTSSLGLGSQSDGLSGCIADGVCDTDRPNRCGSIVIEGAKRESVLSLPLPSLLAPSSKIVHICYRLRIPPGC